MDNYISKKINEIKEKSKVSRSSGHLTHILKSAVLSDQMVEINNLYKKVLNNTDYLKCLLVLNLKQVTWQRELRDCYDCSGSIIESFINDMKNLGFIISKQLISIDNILYEAIIRTNPKDFYYQSNKVNLITLTENGKEFSKRIIDDCINIERDDILFTINDIDNKTKSFRKCYQEILNLENKMNNNSLSNKIINGNRYIEYPDGTIIVKETIKSKKNKEEVKKALLEVKKELLLEKEKKGLLLSNRELKDLKTLLSSNKMLNTS